MKNKYVIILIIGLVILTIIGLGIAIKKYIDNEKINKEVYINNVNILETDVANGNYNDKIVKDYETRAIVTDSLVKYLDKVKDKDFKTSYDMLYYQYRRYIKIDKKKYSEIMNNMLDDNKIYSFGRIYKKNDKEYIVVCNIKNDVLTEDMTDSEIIAAENIKTYYFVVILDQKDQKFAISYDGYYQRGGNI